MMQVVVPTGLAPGEAFMVQAPDGQMMQVVVPAGVRPGQTFNVQTPTGAMLQTVVPAGVEPGQTIMITTEQTMQPAQPAQMTMQREDLSAEDAAAAESRDVAYGCF